MKKLKGFTLIELIIVMALFSLVMYSVLQFLSPVSAFFVRSSNFETTTACIDNMKRAIEGNLKYADRVRAYAGYGIDTTSIDANVQTFWSDFFEDRELMDCKGNISVMIFDNTSTGTSWSIGDLTDFNRQKLNSGKITMLTYSFDKTSCTLANTQEWYVNQKMYANYNYKFLMGSGTEGFKLESGATFDPSDCTITIVSKEIVRDKDHPGTVVESATENTSVASFSMKNVLDATVKYASPQYDYKIIKNPNGDTTYELSDDKSKIEKMKYIVEKDASDTPIPHSRYEELDRAPGAADDASFYFIFTQAETVYDAGERVYNPAAGVFVKPADPKSDPDYDDVYLRKVEDVYKESGV